MRTKKLLGQNFLKNKKILEEIIRVGEVSKMDTVLEIGPGHGELTELLAKSAKKIIAIEKDLDLIPALREKFSKNKNVEIRQGDILAVKPPLGGFTAKSYKIVANIPYYITSRLLRNFLTAKNKPKSIVLMVQFEVAKRICARPPDLNLLALSVQAYGRPKFIRKVSKNFFQPRPKVDSAIIKITDISDEWFRKNKIDEKKFFELARRAFGQKRKMLRHSLKLPKSDFGKKRPQELALEDWAKIISA